MQLFTIHTGKQKAVTCRLYYAENADQVVIIVPAAGVVQLFYKNIAEFFRNNRISAITFDYTGIGESLQGSLRNEDCRLASWGNIDLEAVIQHVIHNFPGQKIILIGHSIGGQLIGLAPSSCKATKIILVSAQSGYWRFWKGAGRMRMWVNWYLLVPVLTRLFGYLPAKRISRMENLPKNVALEWARWCRSSGYLCAPLLRNDLYFDRIKGKLTSISVSDDLLAPVKSVEWLTEQFSGAGIKRLHLLPEHFNCLNIGHFSLFTEKFRDSFWPVLYKEANGWRD
ncbi:MAG: alpha/beta fold hydrolase [Chitinophagaceae bacterium]